MWSYMQHNLGWNGTEQNSPMLQSKRSSPTGASKAKHEAQEDWLFYYKWEANTQEPELAHGVEATGQSLKTRWVKG